MFVQKISGITNKWALPKLDSRQLVVLALLMGLDLVLGKLTIGTNVIKVGFVFIAISLIAKWYGPLWTMLIALVLGWSYRLHRKYLLITFITFLAGLVYTLVYIYPINEVLMMQAGGDRSAEEIQAMTDTAIKQSRPEN